MASLDEILHDDIDGIEEISERVRAAIEARRPQLAKIMRDADDVEEGLLAFAALVADDLATYTTEAVQVGRRTGEAIMSL